MSWEVFTISNQHCVREPALGENISFNFQKYFIQFYYFIEFINYIIFVTFKNINTDLSSHLIKLHPRLAEVLRLDSLGKAF